MINLRHTKKCAKFFGPPCIYLELSVECRANEERDLGGGELVTDCRSVLGLVLQVLEQHGRQVFWSYSEEAHQFGVTRLDG